MTRSRFSLGLAVAILAALGSPAFAQGQKLLSLDDLFDPQKKLSFGTPTFGSGGYTWLNDKEYLRTRTVKGGVEHVRVDAISGTETLLFEPAKLAAALSAVPGVSPDEAGSEMRTIMARLEAEYPETNAGWSADVVPLHREIVGDVRPALLAFSGAMALLGLVGLTARRRRRSA